MTGNYPQEKIIHEPTGLEHWEEMEAVGGNSLSTLNKVGFGRVLDLMLNFLSAHFCLSRQPVSLRAMTWGWDGEFSYSNPRFACQLPEEVLSGTADFHHSHKKKKDSESGLTLGTYSPGNQNASPQTVLLALNILSWCL